MLAKTNQDTNTLFYSTVIRGGKKSRLDCGANACPLQTPTSTFSAIEVKCKYSALNYKNILAAVRLFQFTLIQTGSGELPGILKTLINGKPYISCQQASTCNLS